MHLSSRFAFIWIYRLTDLCRGNAGEGRRGDAAPVPDGPSSPDQSFWPIVRVIEALYWAKGPGLEQAVEETLIAAGLVAVRIVRQPAGEEDRPGLDLCGTGCGFRHTYKSDQKAIAWNKAKQVMKQGAGQNPVNCVCIAR